MKSGRQRLKSMQRKPLNSSLKPIMINIQRPPLTLQKDREELLAFYDFPAKHWQSIRTSNPIESTFGTIRHRTRRTKGCLNREGMLHMMFKLGQCAEKNWRKLRGFDYLAKVIEGIQFSDGIEVIPEIRIAA